MDWLTDWLTARLTNWLRGRLTNRLITDYCFTLVFHSCRRHWRLFNLNCPSATSRFSRPGLMIMAGPRVPRNLYAIVICTLRHGLIERTHPQKKFNEPSVIDWSPKKWRGAAPACQWAIKSLMSPRWVRIPIPSSQLTATGWISMIPSRWLTILWGIYAGPPVRLSGKCRRQMFARP